MDRDYAEIDNIEAAIAAPFVREEALMREANIPILERRLELHACIADQLPVARSDRTRGRCEAVAAFLAAPLPHMIAPRPRCATFLQLSCNFPWHCAQKPV